MTPDEVHAKVQHIATLANDAEAAHGAEDDLWQDVLTAIKDGAPEAADLASEALKTREIDFPRWYA